MAIDGSANRWNSPGIASCVGCICNERHQRDVAGNGILLVQVDLHVVDAGTGIVLNIVRLSIVPCRIQQWRVLIRKNSLVLGCKINMLRLSANETNDTMLT